jgi:hypothetical protein
MLAKVNRIWGTCIIGAIVAIVTIEGLIDTQAFFFVAIFFCARVAIPAVQI